MKTSSYQYFENTYAISKLAFGAIGTPAYAPHDKPGPGPDTPGLDWAGINVFSASYEDWGRADVIFFSGVAPYETKSVLFTSWIMHGQNPDKKLIFALPRKTMGVAWGEQRGGLFLQVIPGTDTVLHLALIRIILENGWEDRDFIDRGVANSWEIDAGRGRGTRNTPWQWFTTWGRYGIDFAGYRKWILGYRWAELDTAARLTGVPAPALRHAARVAPPPGPVGGAGTRPGGVISRGGGHQRGWMGGAGYPRGLSPEKYPGRRKKEIDLDRWGVDGHVRFAWVIGTTWLEATWTEPGLRKARPGPTGKGLHHNTSFNPKAAIE